MLEIFLQSSSVGPFDAAGPRHLPTVPICYNAALLVMTEFNVLFHVLKTACNA